MNALPPEFEPAAHSAYVPPRAAKPRTKLAVALEQGRNRLMVTAAVVSLAFGAIGVKLMMATLLADGAEPRKHEALDLDSSPVNRADILDRNGNLLATSLAMQSLYADSKAVIDPVQSAHKLIEALPELANERKELVAKLSSGKRFVWLKRNLTPRQQYAVHRQGIPGVYFEREERRFYPAGNLTSHVVGYTGVDNNGLGGLEQSFNKRLTSEPGKPLRLSLDLRVQHILKKEMLTTIEEFSAIGGAGIVYDVRNGEVVAMVSLPDFDPHNPAVPPEAASDQDKNPLFNRATLGVYEMGSTFKVFNSAMALDSGKVRVSDYFDAANGIRIGRFTISDYHNMHRALTVAEVFQHSSNIGSVRMMQAAGIQTQRDFMAKVGFMRPTTLELPENGWPLVPNPWREVNAMTISFGHGISVSPMHTVAAAAATVNGGIMHRPTLLRHQDGEPVPGERVLSERTSDIMRRLFRFVVTDGTAKGANATGYVVGGKTGTADKQKGRSYVRNSRMSSFLGAFPMHDPRYIVYVLIDEPKGTKQSYGFATGGWVGAPLVGRIVRQIGPLLNVAPVDETSPQILNAVYMSTSGSIVPPPPAPTKGSSVASIPPAGQPH
ncbi:penicillin-binding protein 2 [Azospirillum sp. SYSU D00513]|uniref:peptidoglycan D,D-transpeptidase FtsI family protein n=1 Tax=Azospirillum sp. SYSU D00513 TaxID=2812561 RepID=UPI001A9713A3|nr:penicillin-binding protein 2 [Azospirillum sp. SYSU D00513]